MVTSPVPRRSPYLNTTTPGGETCTVTGTVSAPPEGAADPDGAAVVTGDAVASAVGGGATAARGNAAGAREGVTIGGAGGSVATASGSELDERAASQTTPADTTIAAASHAFQRLWGRNARAENSSSGST